MQKKEEESFKTHETRRILRIADILLDDGDGDGDLFEMDQPRKTDHHLTIIQCSTPRRIVSRWFSALKRARHRKVNARSDKRDNEIVKESNLPHTRCSTNGFNSDGGSGRCGMDSSSFNLGVACGLLCVVAAGKNELNKMVELRTQMELILQNAKQEMGGKNALTNNPKPAAESNEINFTSFSTNFQQASTSGSQFSLQSVGGRDECSDYCVGNEGEGDEYVAGIDQLEAELRAELERMQLQLDSESNSSISKSPQQQRLEGMGDIGSNRREGDSASTDYSDHEMLWGCGFAPLELERKLHLVLEARQEERIKELEDALECAEQKLEEKEREVSWWRNAAILMSGRDPEPSYSHG
ncbi:protein POLAR LOCALIZATION DURING ASYMMETRIC DIVISION AND REDISTRIBUTION [Rosa rugosa]|uniref:protein POLAR LOCALIZATION DURING ASYMMETRIC DIVISION AND REDISTRIBUTION n=1 Tax=Rosa rugosa TaxID=74645 RepID=UPI002B408974|nr:protein POLAR LOCALIZATION DURING ASYMMETRIC DIVISION AND REDISTRIBUTION [Rosa rugosa]